MKKKVSRKVSLSLTQSLAKIKILLSTFCETLRFISETQREIKRNFLDNPKGVGLVVKRSVSAVSYLIARIMIAPMITSR